jgi:hypothetical protein
MYSSHFPLIRLFLLATLAGPLAFVVACGPSAPPPTVTAEFIVTPADEGAPDFLRTPEGALSPGLAEGDSYPAPPPAVDERDYPAPVLTSSVDGRRYTALQSYPLAEEIALTEFSADAYLAAIAPSHLMVRNLGNLPVLPGWFYKFRRPESRREFIVQVVDDVVTGSTLTESLRDPEKTERLIDLSQVVLDSPSVFELFGEFAAENGLASPDDVLYDLELVNLEGSGGATWLVVDAVTFERLFALDALTGEQARNPYE